MKDAKGFSPKAHGISDKFSWRLYKFLKKHKNLRIMYYRKTPMGKIVEFDPTKSQHLMQLFAMIDGLSLAGACFNSIMSNSEYWNEIYAFDVWGVDNFVDVTDWFFKEYARTGRCMFDREHSMWWQGKENRYTFINANSRRCNWCGEWQRRKIEKQITVKRENVWAREA